MVEDRVKMGGCDGVPCYLMLRSGGFSLLTDTFDLELKLLIIHSVGKK